MYVYLNSVKNCPAPISAKIITKQNVIEDSL